MSDKNKKPKKFRNGILTASMLLTAFLCINSVATNFIGSDNPTKPSASQSSGIQLEEDSRYFAYMGGPGDKQVLFSGYVDGDDSDAISTFSASFEMERDGEPLDVKYIFDVKDDNSNMVVTATNSNGDVVINDTSSSEIAKKLHALAQVSATYLQSSKDELSQTDKGNMFWALLNLAQEAILDFDKTYCDGANNAENSNRENEKSPKSDLISKIVSNARVRTA